MLDIAAEYDLATKRSPDSLHEALHEKLLNLPEELTEQKAILLAASLLQRSKIKLVNFKSNA